MELIERYLYEVGRHLPSKQRKDILAELRSNLEDTLEAQTGGVEPTEEDVALVLREMGPPKEVADSYNPDQQYLIGPNLYPVFTLVLGIVFVAVIGAQLLAIAVSFFLSSQALNFWAQFLGILNSLPAALGFVVIIFAILQRLDVQFDEDEEAEEFDPRKLPNIATVEPINQGEQALSIIISVIVLTFLAYIAGQGGFSGVDISGVDGVIIITNPVLDQYLPWLVLSMVLSIVVDIVLLWRGQWTTGSRITKIAADLFGLVVLGLILQGHNAWLAENNVVGYLDWLPYLADILNHDIQLIGMSIFRMIFGIAFIITLIEVLVQVFRIIQSRFRSRTVDDIKYAEVG